MIQNPPRLDPTRIRQDFPILATESRGKKLVYLDNAATSQKPQAVLDALNEYWTQENANVHRGVHYLSGLATARFEAARETVRTFLNAAGTNEIIFTKGCTEAINLVATCLSRPIGNNGTSPHDPDRLPLLIQNQQSKTPNPTILLSNLEHHSNIVPWQIAAEQVGAEIKVIPVTDEGELDLEAYEKLLKDNPVALVGIVHVSNAIGTVNPMEQMIAMAHEAGALVMVDGAQGGPHLRLDVQALDADFYTLSCHKIYAPTGVGVLYGKRHLLEAMPPYHGGGDMIRSVSFEGTTYAALPSKYEAGTPNVGGVVGLAAAIKYIGSLAPQPTGHLAQDLDQAFAAIGDYEHELGQYATEKIAEIPGVRLVGTAKDKAAIVSFVMEGVHPHDIGTILDSEMIAVRVGHHCTQPLMTRFGLPATARASFAFYNTQEEADALVKALYKVREMFG